MARLYSRSSHGAHAEIGQQALARASPALSLASFFSTCGVIKPIDTALHVKPATLSYAEQFLGLASPQRRASAIDVKNRHIPSMVRHPTCFGAPTAMSAEVSHLPGSRAPRLSLRPCAALLAVTNLGERVKRRFMRKGVSSSLTVRTGE
jgi:hypothetical protein